MYQRQREGRSVLFVATLAIVLFGLALIPAAFAQSPVCDRTFTLNGDFDLGILENVNHDAPNGDQLQLNAVISPRPFINIACSDRGTMVRVNVNTGQVLGEYWTSPSGRQKNPSRTTVDVKGNVWVSNRNEALLVGDEIYGSCVKIGIVIGGTRCDADRTPNPAGLYLMPPFEYCTAVDRDGDGLIRTSMGLGDILPWPNVTDGNVKADGIVHDAVDECILIYKLLPGAPNARHMSIASDNNPWVGGYYNTSQPRMFLKLDQNTGAVLSSFNAATIGCGGYGGLIDGNNVLWSSGISQGRVLRYDLTSGTSQCINNYGAYGLGIDGTGHVWNSSYYNGTVTKYDPNGTFVGTYSTSGTYPRGVAVTSDGDVWVANSGSGTVARLSNSGTLRKVITVGSTPTGVAVDANGKVWVTNFMSDDAMRIDPAAGLDGLGLVDLTVALGSTAGPYNYSDMTGFIAVGTTAPQGTWTVIHDGAVAGMGWGKLSWNGATPAGTGIKVEVRAANLMSELCLQPWTEVQNNVSICEAAIIGRYIAVRVTLSRTAPLSTPVLYDLTVQCCNHQPVALCKDILLDADANCQATALPADVNNGSYDPDGDAFTLTMSPAGPFGLGNTNVTLTATDVWGASSSCGAVVTVRDVTAPVISVASAPSMWPPNHNYQLFTVTDFVTAVADNCDDELGIGDVVITSVTSDEPENANGNGDGNTVDDIVITSNCQQVYLRKERAGGGNGRVYTVHLALTDASNQTGTAEIDVFVRHNPDAMPVDDGDVYVENCGTPKRGSFAALANSGFELLQNYPNPFNPSTTIQFSVPTEGRVQLSVFDTYSRRVRVLVDDVLLPGAYAVPFDATGLASGSYFYRLESNGVILSRVMNIVR
ncbi:MAG: hypothetical protein HY962_16060 [Ignavibacteriae bacterium]|nr:hypothetical protein [Ignavibacteriota bacterium]